jgi:hypothetical protein
VQKVAQTMAKWFANYVRIVCKLWRNCVRIDANGHRCVIAPDDHMQTIISNYYLKLLFEIII